MKVLLVDDANTLTSIVRVYLMGFGFDFADAKDGRAALEKVRSWRPNVVISDVKMPIMTGFELCAAVRGDKELHDTPIILLTSGGDATARHKALLFGANAFLTKPISVDELRETVQKVLKLPGQPASRPQSRP